jgi:hypothetical protein
MKHSKERSSPQEAVSLLLGWEKNMSVVTSSRSVERIIAGAVRRGSLSEKPLSEVNSAQRVGLINRNRNVVAETMRGPANTAAHPLQARPLPMTWFMCA